MLILARGRWLCITIPLRWCCVCTHICLSVMPGAAVTVSFSVYLGVLTSSFSCFLGKFAKCVHRLCLLEPAVLPVSEVSPFVVEVALGINAQHRDAVLLALTVLARDLLFFAIALCVIVLSTPEAHKRCIHVVGYLISHAFSVSMLRLNSIVGYCVTIRGRI